MVEVAPLHQNVSSRPEPAEPQNLQTAQPATKTGAQHTRSTSHRSCIPQRFPQKDKSLGHGPMQEVPPTRDRHPLSQALYEVQRPAQSPQKEGREGLPRNPSTLRRPENHPVHLTLHTRHAPLRQIHRYSTLPRRLKHF